MVGVCSDAYLTDEPGRRKPNIPAQRRGCYRKLDDCCWVPAAATKSMAAAGSDIKSGMMSRRTLQLEILHNRFLFVVTVRLLVNLNESLRDQREGNE